MRLLTLFGVFEFIMKKENTSKLKTTATVLKVNKCEPLETPKYEQ